jgi:hypothetical protein
MLKAVEGTYHDGTIDLDEIPSGVEQARVVVTFLEATEKTASDTLRRNPDARIAALNAWLSGLPRVPSLPLSAFDREHIYE